MVGGRGSVRGEGWEQAHAAIVMPHYLHIDLHPIGNNTDNYFYIAMLFLCRGAFFFYISPLFIVSSSFFFLKMDFFMRNPS